MNPYPEGIDAVVDQVKREWDWLDKHPGWEIRRSRGRLGVVWYGAYKGGEEEPVASYEHLEQLLDRLDAIEGT